MKTKSLPSRLFNRHSEEASGETASPAAACKYQRHVDSEESCAEGGDRHPEEEEDEDVGRQNEKCHREIHFAFLPERYEPLVDDEAKQEKKKRKKEKYKKVKKNVGKALRSSWKCLMLGLYNFALGYSTPMAMAATFVPDFHRGRNGT